jgi:Flp pilus assembly protein TadD
MPEITVEKAIEMAEQFKARGKTADAVNIYQQILTVAPRNTLIISRLGICLGEASRLAEARDLFQRAVEIEPAFVDAWANLSMAYERLDDLDRAIAARRKAIELVSNSAEYWHRLGACLGKKKDFGPAIEALRKSLELDPTSDTSHHDLVLALSRDGQLEMAEKELFDRIAPTKTVDAERVRPLADGFKVIGDFRRATEVWRRAAKLDPRSHEAIGQLAMCLITLGDYESGWRLYESRWDCDSFGENSRRDPARQWGQPLVGRPDVSGKTILLYSEQGIGDTIHFVRYAALFARRGARVIVQCPWAIKSLLEKANGVRLVYSQHEELPTFDWHIPVMSLPYVFQTTIETIPAEIPYLTVDPTRRKSWATRIESRSPEKTKLRVGIAWAGNPKHKNDARRSIHPDLLAPLADVDRVAFFNLQKSNENEKAAIQPARPKLIDFASSLHDFAETAALIDNLDLVICADTAVAHLAGAIGKPVWTLLPFVPDFRWGLEQASTPWYPTMQLFRQPRPEDWAGVVEKVVEVLKARAAEFTPR